MSFFFVIETEGRETKTFCRGLLRREEKVPCHTSKCAQIESETDPHNEREGGAGHRHRDTYTE